MTDDQSADPVGPMPDESDEQVEVIPVRGDLFGARKAIKEFNTGSVMGLAAVSGKATQFPFPKDDTFQRMQEQAAEQRAQMDRINESMVEAGRRREERAENQAEATIKMQALQAEMLEVLRKQADAAIAMAENQQAALDQIAEVMKEQRDSATRGIFFYVVVGLATALAGVAALYPMNWAARAVTVGVTLAISLIAGALGVVIHARQRRSSHRS